MDAQTNGTAPRTGTARVKRGMAEMLKGGVIMDVVTPEQARIAEAAGAVAVMALERVPADIRAQGGVSRMSDPDMIEGIIEAVTIPVMAKARIGHFVEAQILQAQVTVDTAKVNMGYTRIVAPIDGQVVAIVTQQGQTVNANQSAPTIVMLAQLDKMTVSAEISEADVEKVNEGQDVYFTTLGDANTKHYAKLRTVAPAPDSIESQTSSSSSSSSTSAVYYNGLFDVDNADGKLKTGMTAQVNIVMASAKDAITVPSAALERHGRQGYTVKVVQPNGEIEQRKVKVGINT